MFAADHAVSYDEFVVFKTFANVSDFDASATPECNVTKDAPDLKCVIDTAGRSPARETVVC